MELLSGLVCLLTLFHTAPTSAYIWNFAWSSHLNVDKEYNDNIPHPRNLKRNSERSLTMDDTEENATERLFPCRSDKSCGRGKFCDQHYGSCEYHRQEGDTCRRDGHCDRGLDCMFGRCQKTIKGTQPGARCKHDRDCGPDMCCARKHGQNICKPKLKIGAKCYVPNGGLAYSFNELCPCEEGLICKNTAKQQSKEEEETWRYWTDFDHMRCKPI